MHDVRPSVAVWRSLWLPPSETFVRDHVASLGRWRPVPVGLFHEPGSLDVRPVRAPFSRSGPTRRLERLADRVGYRGVYGRVLARENVSLVHAHFGTDAVRVLPVARRAGLPLVVTFHGYDVLRAPLQDERYARDLPALFAQAARLYVVSDYLREKLLALGAPPDKVHLHYLGVPVREPLADPAADRRGVVFVGRLREEKGITDLLDAYEALPETLRRATPLDVVGAGPLLEEVRRRAERLDGPVTVHGLRTPEQVREILGRSRVFVGPSRLHSDGSAEPFGLTFVEAALAGCAVVGYRAGGVREGVADGRTGLLVEPGDVGALSEAMASLLADPERARRFGADGQRRVVEEFDVRARTALLEEDYDDVVSRWGRGGGAR